MPLDELLNEPVDSLSPRVMMRAQLLKVMKTAMALQRQARSVTTSYEDEGFANAVERYILPLAPKER